MKCSKCKRMLDDTETVLGGWVCRVCGKFNPKLEPHIQCLEKPAKRNLHFKKIVKQLGKGVEMLKRCCK